MNAARLLPAALAFGALLLGRIHAQTPERPALSTLVSPATLDPQPPPHSAAGLAHAPAYREVKLTSGPLADQAAAAREFYLRIPDDDLLQGFRLRAGLPAPGKPMGGWYDPDNFAGAHPFGQFISALSRFYAGTGDDRFRKKVERLVPGFAETIAPDGFFYSSEKARRDWQCYIYDKNCAGMRDAATLCDVALARTVLSRMTDWAEKNLARRNDEWYTLPANLYDCSALTGEGRYTTMAKEFDYSAEFFDAFAAGRDAFRPTQHAYSHVNALFSACRAYAAIGDEKYFNAALTAQRWLESAHSFASGGWGPDERFTEPGGIGDSVHRGHSHFETPCGVYATCNLDRSLLEFTGDPAFGNQAELVLVNGILASLPPRPDGQAFYYSDYSPGATKAYFRDAWPCCAGTYALVAADLGINAWATDEQGPMVVQFVGSRFRTTVAGAPVEIEQATDFPDQFGTTLTVRAPPDASFTLGVRRPRWCMSEPEILCLGRTVRPSSARNALWIPVTPEQRTFTIRFRSVISSASMEVGADRYIAVMDGPVLLVALSAGPVSVKGTLAQGDARLRPVEGIPHTYELDEGGKTLRLMPFYRVKDERYTVFLKSL